MIVSIASPVSSQNASIASWEPISSLNDLRGKRIADTPMEGREGGFHHGRGNHMMYLIRAGVSIDDVKWVESESSDEQFEALKSRRADARFISGGGERYKEMGLHILPLGPLPMINGPTLTTSYTVLQKKGLGDGWSGVGVGIPCQTQREDENFRLAKQANRRDYQYSWLDIRQALSGCRRSSPTTFGASWRRSQTVEPHGALGFALSARARQLGVYR
jgi:hypothetical protein